VVLRVKTGSSNGGTAQNKTRLRGWLKRPLIAMVPQERVKQPSEGL